MTSILTFYLQNSKNVSSLKTLECRLRPIVITVILNTSVFLFQANLNHND